MSAALQKQARLHPQVSPRPMQAAPLHGGQASPTTCVQEQQQRADQLQDLQHLVGILQPVLYDDAAASEVLSEWLSGSDVAVADSDMGSEGVSGRSHAWAAPHTRAPPGSQAAAAAAGAAHAPAMVPQVLSFTPAAASSRPGSMEQQPQQAGSSAARTTMQQGQNSAGAATQPRQPQLQPRLWAQNPQSPHTGGYSSSGGGAMPVLQPTAASPGSSSITVRQPVTGDRTTGRAWF